MLSIIIAVFLLVLCIAYLKRNTCECVATCNSDTGLLDPVVCTCRASTHTPTTTVVEDDGGWSYANEYYREGWHNTKAYGYMPIYSLDISDEEFGVWCSELEVLLYVPRTKRSPTTFHVVEEQVVVTKSERREEMTFEEKAYNKSIRSRVDHSRPRSKRTLRYHRRGHA